MKSIYKYPVNPLDYKIIKGTIEKFLSVEYQPNNGICVWAAIDTNLPEEEYIVSCYGTGHKLPNDPGEYIGTVQMYSGEMVLHFFVKKADQLKRERELIQEYDLEL